jgi:c-di-GMP-binding flagellar brake protein YcgR
MDYDNLNSDRRRFQRLKFNLSVNYRVDEPWYVRLKFKGQEIEATAINLSEGGLAILTGYDIPVASLLVLKFSLFKLDRSGEVCFYDPIEISGQVRSNMVYEKNKFRLGLCFVKAQSPVDSRIGAFVKLAS